VAFEIAEGANFEEAEFMAEAGLVAKAFMDRAFQS